MEHKTYPAYLDIAEDIQAAVFDYMDKLIENGDINPQFGQQIAEDIAYDVVAGAFVKFEKSKKINT